MSLTFPNRSRSFDKAHNRVRFSGYDGMFQIQYFLDADALALDQMAGEAGILSAFDRRWDEIKTAAARSYARNRRNLYVLTAEDF